MAARVVHDQMSRSWRVVCSVHGVLASYAKFWVASRDARQHNEGCGEGQ